MLNCHRTEHMKASLFYRIAAVLLLLFAAGHTLGFRQSDPTWGVETLLGSMRSIHFDVQGFSRTYWERRGHRAARLHIRHLQEYLAAGPTRRDIQPRRRPLHRDPMRPVMFPEQPRD